MDKIFVGTNFSSDKIFVTSKKFRHFCPTKFSPIRYSKKADIIGIEKTRRCPLCRDFLMRLLIKIYPFRYGLVLHYATIIYLGQKEELSRISAHIFFWCLGRNMVGICYYDNRWVSEDNIILFRKISDCIIKCNNENSGTMEEIFHLRNKLLHSD